MAPKAIADAGNAQVVTVTGVLGAVVGSGRHEEPMASAVLTCADGVVRAEVWPAPFLMYGHLIADGAEVTATGTVDRRDALVFRVDRIELPVAAGTVSAAAERAAEVDRIVGELTDTRRRNRISLVSVARRVGVSYQAVAAWETGRSRPTNENLAAWKAVLAGMNGAGR